MPVCVPQAVIPIKILSALKCSVTCDAQGESPMLLTAEGHRRGTNLKKKKIEPEYG